MTNKDNETLKDEKLNTEEKVVQEELEVEEQPEKKVKVEVKTKVKESAKIKELKEENNDLKNRYYKAIADMDNQRKRYEKDYLTAVKYSSQSLFEKLLPSYEMFSMVVESVDNLPVEVQAYAKGFEMVYRQMIQAFESEGIVEIKTSVGDKFDHNKHSAMETQEVDKKELDGTITKIIRKGYMIHDRLIKPAAVVVGKYNEK